MINEHAICHEAGHAVVAMYFGLTVTGISVKQSIPTAVFSVSGATGQQACIVYSAGAAAEKIEFGYFDAASDSDKLIIQRAGGGKLEDYLGHAVQIIRANAKCHKELWNEMAKNWVAEEVESSFSGSNSDKLNFELLNGTTIKEIWQLNHP
jgi:hypothetical protein